MCVLCEQSGVFRSGAGFRADGGVAGGGGGGDSPTFAAPYASPQAGFAEQAAWGAAWAASYAGGNDATPGAAGSTTVTASGDSNINTILGGMKWDTTSLTASIPSSSAAYSYWPENGLAAGTFSALNGTQNYAFFSVMDMFKQVSGITYTPGDANADIRGANASVVNANNTAGCPYPENSSRGGDAWFDSDNGSLLAPRVGNYGWATFIHEYGHGMGLKHPHDVVGSFGVGTVIDSMDMTVMSYRSYSGMAGAGPYTNEIWGYAQSLMLYDIAALQYLYGPDYSAEAYNGATTYKFSPTTGQMFVDGVGQGNHGDGTAASNRIYRTIWDGGGEDTYDFSDYTDLAGLKVYLGPGQWTTTAANQLADLDSGSSSTSRIARGNIANAFLNNGDERGLIENARGGAGNDLMEGNQAGNKFWGGNGNDTIRGWDGNDTIQGEGGNDVIEGNNGNDFLNGDGGDDTVLGGDGFDTLFGGGIDNDLLVGDAHADLLVGGHGNDTLIGGFINFSDDGGAVDTLHGGGGDDVYHIRAGDVLGTAANSQGNGDAEVAGGGTDLVISYVGSYTLQSHFENLTLDGSSSTILVGTGNELGNVIHGNGFGNTINGQGGADTLRGFGGNDTINGGEGNDVVEGNDNNDFLNGDGGDDTVLGGNGFDTLFGGGNDNDLLVGDADADLLVGGNGNDTLRGGFIGGGDDSQAPDTLHGGAGDDVYHLQVGDVIATAANSQGQGDAEINGGGTDEVVVYFTGYTLQAFFENLTLNDANTATTGNGNGSNNRITGNSFGNILDGGAGFDTLIGGGGNDTLYGGSENDSLDGGENDDFLDGGTASTGDTLVGGNGNDTYVIDTIFDVVSELGTGTADEIRVRGAIAEYNLTGRNVERLIWDNGTTTAALRYTGGTENNFIRTSDGDDTLNGGQGNDTLEGAGGDDSLIGGEGADSLVGGNGVDTFDGGAGADTLNGGDGGDQYYIDAFDVINDSGATGTDRVFASFNGAVLAPTAEWLELLEVAGVLVGSGNSGNNNVKGNSLGNTLSGGAGGDTLEGLAGNDTLIGGTENDRLEGGADNDWLYGQAGLDTLVGGDGNDTYVIEDVGDLIDDSGGTADTVLSGIASFSLAAHASIENLTGGGVGQRLEGNAGNNVITGTGGADTLVGGGGLDTLRGGAGDDTYEVSTVSVVIEDTSGVDTVVTAIGVFDLSAAGFTTLENLRGTNTLQQALGGNDLNNLIEGSSGKDLILGRGGVDTMNGGAGDDTYDADSMADVIIDSSGLDTIQTTAAMFSIESRSFIENLVGYGTFQRLEGNAGANAITAGAHSDTLIGGGGNDTLDGGLGDDLLDGGTGADRLIGGGGVDGATYALSATGRIVDLTAGAADDGDTLVSIENVFGSAFDDIVFGSSAGNLIDGGGGNDRLFGFGGSDILRGGLGDDVLNGGVGTDTIDGGAGRDTVSFVGFGSGVIVDLAAQATNDGDTLVSIENVIGSGFDDTVYGSAADNVLDGGAGGADKLYGFGGADTVSYASSSTAIIVDLGAQAASDGDLFASIENAIGSSLNDTIFGSEGDNVLDGGAGGADKLYGFGGRDTVSYASLGAGIIIDLSAQAASDGDTFIGVENATGTRFNDTIYGSGGDNVLDGGNGGADKLYGFGGSDTVVYSSATAGIIVDLSVQAASDGDTFIEVENAIGTAFNDSLFGSAADNVFDGGSGGVDKLYGFGGTDTASYVSATSAIIIDLTAQAASDGDTFISIENAVGTAFNDTIYGSGGNNVLDGGAGGADKLYGFGGVDTVSYATSAAGVIIDLAAQAASDGDIFASIENATGSRFSDAFFGSSGANVLNGGGGDDTLWGFGGADVFAFEQGFGKDTVGDFVKGEDKVQFRTNVFASFSAVQAAATQVGADALITLDASNTVTLKNVTFANLQSTDFLFV